MKIDTAIRAYLAGLEEGSYEKVLALFSNNALVHSPLYGVIKAEAFYKDLFSDTRDSSIALKNIFISTDNPLIAAAHFAYDWTLKDGMSAPFECVDIFTLRRREGP